MLLASRAPTARSRSDYPERTAMVLYLLQAANTSNETVLAEVAAEQFNNLDQARDVALSLCHEYGVHIQLIECCGVSQHVREIYDAATYA
jgi:hypothetical protein